jgi:hypothetical protein
MACVYGFENKSCTGDKSAAIFLQSISLIEAALGSKIYVEHSERSDWTLEMVDNMSRESMTTDLDQFTLDRFEKLGNLRIFEDWMKSKTELGSELGLKEYTYDLIIKR